MSAGKAATRRIVKSFGDREEHGTTGIAEIVDYLTAHLGRELTAYVSGVDDMQLWAERENRPQESSAQRLRFAYQAARFVVEAYDDETARIWFFGMNPSLEETAPAYVLRHGSKQEDWRGVVPAAMEFVETAR